MIEPRTLMPVSLGVAWGWTLNQCLEALGDRVVEVREATIEIEAEDGDEVFGVTLGFYSPGALRDIQLTCLPEHLDPALYIEEAPRPADDDRSGWMALTAEFERRQEAVESYYREALQRYQEILGATELQADAREEDWDSACGRFFARAGWTLPGAKVELSLEAENCSDWGFKDVRLTLIDPSSEFFFDRWPPKAINSIDPSVSSIKSTSRPWWRFWRDG